MTPPEARRPAVSERVQMMQVASNVIGLMFHRDAAVRPDRLRGDAPMDSRDLSPEESATYKAALRFLSKEFNLGVSSLGTSGSDGDLPEDPDKNRDRAPISPP